MDWLVFDSPDGFARLASASERAALNAIVDAKREGDGSFRQILEWVYDPEQRVVPPSRQKALEHERDLVVGVLVGEAEARPEPVLTKLRKEVHPQDLPRFARLIGRIQSLVPEEVTGESILLILLPFCRLHLDPHNVEAGMQAEYLCRAGLSESPPEDLTLVFPREASQIAGCWIVVRALAESFRAFSSGRMHATTESERFYEATSAHGLSNLGENFGLESWDKFLTYYVGMNVPAGDDADDLHHGVVDALIQTPIPDPRELRAELKSQRDRLYKYAQYKLADLVAAQRAEVVSVSARTILRWDAEVGRKLSDEECRFMARRKALRQRGAIDGLLSLNQIRKTLTLSYRAVRGAWEELSATGVEATDHFVTKTGKRQPRFSAELAAQIARRAMERGKR